MVDDSTSNQFWLYASWELLFWTYLGTGIFNETLNQFLIGTYYYIVLIYLYLNFDENPGRFIQWFKWAIWLHFPLYFFWDLLVFGLFLVLASWGGSPITNRQYLTITIITTVQIILQSVYHAWIYGLLEKFREADREKFEKTEQSSDKDAEAIL